jgi:Fe2+ transport system protein FeoA
MSGSPGPGRRTLADVRPGTTTSVLALDGLETRLREQLQAYGLAPGRSVLVLQHAPVTVVRIDHTDLAFERHLSAGIVVEHDVAPTPSRRRRFGRN